ncbi:uncharacterized protein LOC100679021 isoform X2 [Nasonia vitripennis]|uniref:Uncharacterized protein n=1 Tax=Nasonia vitripennis TaxID=7425 RepID=A0A7M7HBW6_NASVI|nr:uncharacterized protein LOC100679021 isoform X2 [Nasonia vitripennis]
MSATLLLLLLLLLILGKDVDAAGRCKRALAFRKGSTFFNRLNYKVNIAPYTTFAHASGFKFAWELPVRGEGAREARSTTLQEIREAAESVYESHGFNGKMCLLKSLCQAIDYLAEKDGVLMKVLHLLSGSRSENGTSLLDPLVCGNYANHCPLHLIGFNAFTEH